jgi:hypothetical protein
MGGLMEHMSFAQWQMSRGICPWMFHPRHVTPMVVKAVQPLIDMFTELTESLTEVATTMSSFLKMFIEIMEDNNA